MGRDKFQETMKHMIEYELRWRLEYLLPLFAENLIRALDHGDVDKEILGEFYSVMEAAHARLAFERFEEGVIVKAIAPDYTVACLMPRRECGEPMSYEDFVKLTDSNKPDLNNER